MKFGRPTIAIDDHLDGGDIKLQSSWCYKVGLSNTIGSSNLARL